MNNISKNVKKYREINNITQRELSEISGVTYSTITKLETGVYQNPTIDTLVSISNVLGIGIEKLLENNLNKEKINIINDNQNAKFTFIDLFAGIGGIRLGFEKFGGKSVFSSEIDKFACKTYEANFNEIPFGDIKKIDETDIPDHDILLAGFPCQPFSIAGVSKKNSLGKEHGFFDQTKGTLFFDILRITKEKRPKILFLENVKNLMSHDKGRTFKIILNSLNNLDYNIYYKVYDGKAFVPQHRERTIIVCFDKNYFKGRENFSFPKLPENNLKLADILENNVEEKYTLSDKLWDYLQKYAEKHRIKGNGFGYGMPDLNSYSRTLSARYYKDGSEILISQKNKNPRKLTPRECARLQGFPESFIIPVSNTQAYKQFGNAVVVPLIEFLAKDIVKILEEFNG